MELDINQTISRIRDLEPKENIIYTSETALSAYGKLPNYIKEPYSIVNLENLDENLDINKFYPIPTAMRIYDDDLIVIDGINLAVPGKAMVDLLLSGQIDNIVELLNDIQGTPEELTLKLYIKKYNMQNIVKNIIKNYNLEEFRDVLIE